MTKTGWIRILGAIVLFVLAAGGLMALRSSLQTRRAAIDDAIHQNNRGAALMEQFKHAEAMEAFSRVAELAPEWAPGYVNLGLAALYAREGDAAEMALQQARQLDPRLIEAHYGAALLLKNRGESVAALEALETARALDPNDADILYNLGLLTARERRFDEAAAILRTARDLDPNSMSIRYQLARALLQAGETDAGESEMAAYQDLVVNDSFAMPTGTQYGEAGRYARVVTDYSAFKVRAAATAAALRFTDVTEGSGLDFEHAGPGGEIGEDDGDARRAAARYGSGAAIGDLDGDGLPDLVLANAAADGRAGPAVYRNLGDLRFEEITSKSGVRFEGIGLGVAIADYDNDDHPDLVLTGYGGAVLYRNRGDGSFEDVTAEAGLEVEGFAAGVCWVDVDHDGDLDLFIARLPQPDGGGETGALLYLNLGNGRFREESSRLGLGGPKEGALGAVFSDLDVDRDIDVVISSASGRAVVLDNRRDKGFGYIGDDTGLPHAGADRGVSAGDVDGDGLPDLVFAAGEGSADRIYLNGGDGTWQGRELPGSAVASSYGSVLFDADNDADLDLLLAGSGLRLYLNDGRGNFTDATAASALSSIDLTDGRAAVAADFDADGDVDVVVTRNGGPVTLLRNDGGNENNWLEVITRGLNSNRDGIGTKVELQAGPVWQRREVHGGSGYLSQSSGTTHFGLGERRLADFVRLIWPGGVLQAELDIAAGQRVEQVELDRKGSSCPLLFSWNGGKHEFVTDFLGVGGLGLWLAPGVYGQPDPEEYVKIEPDQLLPRDGAYYFQVMENLEEVTYLDHVTLISIDHPKEYDVYPNESFGNQHPAEHRIYAIPIKGRIFPLKAVDNRGRQVLDRIVAIDRRYPDNFRLHRLAGFAEMHHLTLEFPRDVEGEEGLVLFLYGWVDYEYSSTNFAAHQSGLTLKLPVLEMEGEDGQFEPVIDSMGFPAGEPRMMTVDLSMLGPLKRRSLRIRSNMRIYWDQIFLARPLDDEEMDEQVKVMEIPLGAAHLHRRGYPREHSPDGRKPLVYDYGIMDNTQPFKTITGNYTRFGRVTELLKRTDDRFVIFGKGEEITLEFSPRHLDDPPRGSRRSFLLHATGYCKDMDPHTAHGDTVEPLPFRAMSGYPYPENESYPDTIDHREYLEKYNTRRLEGR